MSVKSTLSLVTRSSRHGPLSCRYCLQLSFITSTPLSVVAQTCGAFAVKSAAAMASTHSGQQPHRSRIDGDSVDGDSDILAEVKAMKCCICGSKDGVFCTKFYPKGVCGACGLKCVVCGNTISRDNGSDVCDVCTRRKNALDEDSFASLSSNGES